MKILIIGHARHGKDSAAEIINQEFGLKFASSSETAMKIFLFDALKDIYVYETMEDCFADRVNHRAEWKRLINEYNKNDKARLAKGILEHSDIYVGMRDYDEIAECKKQNLFDLIIWVDASDRLPLEHSSSFNITKYDADIIIDNNYSYDKLKSNIVRLFRNFKLK